MKTRLAAMAALALLAGGAAAKEVGTVRANVELKTAPYSDAKSAGKVAADTRVEVLERRGAWVRIAHAELDGWTRLHQVRLGEGPEKQGASGLSQLWNFGTTGRSGTQGLVATTGIRGMSAEQLKEAKPNPEEVEKLEQYRADEAQARALASAAGLERKDVPWLPQPE